MTERALLLRVTLVVAAGTVPLPAPRSLAAQDTTAGKRVYVKWCAGCHGDAGAGDGAAAAYMLPRPRNFTSGLYKIRTTASGQLPTDADLERAIDEGLPGSAMPGWKGRLSQAERRDVRAYIKTFSSFFADTSQHVVALKFSSPPGGGTSVAALKVGRQFYDSIGGRKCHGDQGRGDGRSAATLKDDADFPIFAADLHQSWRFRGGGSVEDIYRRVCTGLGGQPHPAVAGHDSGPGPKAEPWPDQLAVQFPRHLPQGMERPYFLMGATTDPVYQWRWTSRPRRAFAGLARGIERFDTLPGAPAGEATYEHGEWRLVLTRALATPDTANEVQLEAGRAIPMAFFAWDGSSGEHGSRMAVSTWYFLALDRPTPPGVFISPVLAMLVTLGLGLAVVRRAQRRGARHVS